MTIFLLLLFAAILVKPGILGALQPWLRRYTSDGLESACAGGAPEVVTPDVGVLADYGNRRHRPRRPCCGHRRTPVVMKFRASPTCGHLGDLLLAY